MMPDYNPAPSLPIPIIRAQCTQLGLAIDVSTDGGETWTLVQLSRYINRASASVRQYSQCIDPARDRAEYIQELRERGVTFTLASEC